MSDDGEDSLKAALPPLAQARLQSLRVVDDTVSLVLEVGGLDIPPEVFESHPEYFRYLMVRQAFDRLDTGDADLVNSAGLPASPFRSDDW